MNLVEFPFATLSRRPTMGSIKCQRWISDAKGERRPQRWVVQGGSESGLPTEFDERIYVALMAITKRQGYAQRKVPFSVYSLLKIMGESTDSKHYRSVERSLERLLRASIVAEGAFWDADKKALVHLANGFHLIERYWLAYKEGDLKVVEREGIQGYVVWGQEIWTSFQSGYLKQLNLDFFFSLQTPVARRLYRFLDKKMHRRQQMEIDIFQLSQQLGMAWYRYPAKVREKLQPGIDELISKGFLASGEMIKVKGYTRMRFIKGSGQATPVSSSAADPKPEGNSDATPRAAESCGQYGCDAGTWRRAMAEEHKVSDEHVELWERVLARSRKKLSKYMYQLWLVRTLLIALDGVQATILVPNDFYRNGIHGRYEDLLLEALRQEGHSDCTLVYRLAEEQEIDGSHIPISPRVPPMVATTRRRYGC